MTLALILFYIILVLIRPQEYIQGMENSPLLSSVLLLTFFFWILNIKKNFSIPQPMLVTSFFSVAVLSVLIAGGDGGVSEAVGKLLPTWMVFMVLSMTATTSSKIKISLDVIAVCAFVLAVHSIEQYLTGYGWTGLPLSPLDGRVRYIGIFNDPNDLGTLFVSCTPIVLSWFGRESSYLVKIVYLVMLLVLLVAIYLTDSRGVMLAGGLIVLLEIGKRKGAATAGVIAVFLGTVAVGYTRLSQLSVDEESASGRIEAWYQGVLMFKSNPILGVGYSNFIDHHHKTAHNSFMLVLAETGVVGFFFWFSLIVFTLVILINFLRKPKLEISGLNNAEDIGTWEDYKALTWTYLVMLLGYLSSITFLSRSYDPYFYIILALGAGLTIALQERYKVMPEIRIVDKMGGWFAIAIGGVVFIVFSVKLLLFMQG